MSNLCHNLRESFVDRRLGGGQRLGGRHLADGVVERLPRK
jgi:hypothetical protein